MLPGSAGCLCVLCVCRSPHRTTPPTHSRHPRPHQLRITQPRPSLPKIRIIPTVTGVHNKHTFAIKDVNRRPRSQCATYRQIDRNILRVTLAKSTQIRRLRMLRAKLLKRAAPLRPRHSRRHQRQHNHARQHEPNPTDDEPPSLHSQRYQTRADSTTSRTRPRLSSHSSHVPSNAVPRRSRWHAASQQHPTCTPRHQHRLDPCSLLPPENRQSKNAQRPGIAGPQSACVGSTCPACPACDPQSSLHTTHARVSLTITSLTASSSFPGLQAVQASRRCVLPARQSASAARRSVAAAP